MTWRHRLSAGDPTVSEPTEPAAGQSKDGYTGVMLVPLPGVFESMRKRLLAVRLLAVVASLAARLAMGQCVLGPLDEDIRSSETILIGTVVAGVVVEGTPATRAPTFI